MTRTPRKRTDAELVSFSADEAAVINGLDEDEEVTVTFSSARGDFDLHYQ